MIRRMFKVLMIAALMAGVASTVNAEVKTDLTGVFYGAFGQFTSNQEVDARDSDGTTAADAAEASQYIAPYEIEIGLRVKSGKVSAYGWFENLNTDNFSRWEAGTQSHGAAKGYVNYQASDAFSFRLGTIIPDESVMMTFTQDLGSFGMSGGLGSLHGSATYVREPGAMVRYHVNPYLSAGLALYATDIFWNEGAYGEKYRAAIESSTTTNLAAVGGGSCGQATDVCGKAHTGKSGNGMTLGVSGLVHKQVMVRAVYGTSKGDNYDGGPTNDSTRMGLSALYRLTKSIQIFGTYISGETDFLTSIDPFAGTAIDGTALDPGAIDGKIKTADMGLQIKVALGPGKLTVGYGSVDTDVEAYGSIVEAASTVIVNNDLVYNYPLADRTTLKAIYTSLSITPDSGDAYTKSFIGAAFVTRF